MLKTENSCHIELETTLQSSMKDETSKLSDSHYFDHLKSTDFKFTLTLFKKDVC